MVINAAWIRSLRSNVSVCGATKTRLLMCPKGRSHEALYQVAWGGGREQREAILANTPNAALRLFIVQLSANVKDPMRGCSVLLKENVPEIISQLRKQPQRIHATLMTIDMMTLENVWNELEYGLDVRRVTQGAHIEHLYSVQKS
ncbi:hypothetical protein AVEN_211420-1 [Araneus ventricosus]|uniref:Uncharacterized protein n=1 Tax=Araneus ventricosus TaxID=182803 RepID=A0A4Y2D8W0_ARAVE|nr:hypothetical protein AVEN_211420-1 [Araneus ventricosus]